MTHTLPDHGLVFRRPEARDLPALLKFKNDPEVTDLLGGFNTGMSTADGSAWLERRHERDDELIYVLATTEDACVGHVGLYQIDHRIRSAEFAIMLGVKSMWGRGYGRASTRWMVEFGFAQLNLNRVYLSVLDSNPRARRLYENIGFTEEGRLREAQYKNGRYHDVVRMAMLRHEWEALTPPAAPEPEAETD